MNSVEVHRQSVPRKVSWGILLILVIVGAVLRWRYIQEISLFIDEFVTAWAARNVPLRGIPSFPSGNIYPHGFVFTYLEVPFVLGQFNETLARIPGLVVSLVGILVAYGIGRRLFDERVGLIAAAAMAVDPDGILWGGRARMYGLLQLLTLLVVYLYYRGLVEDRARYRYLALGLAVIAVFTHAEAVLLIAALGVATLVVLPWRRIFRPSVILPFVLAGLGAGVFLLISKYGQPGHLETLQESRPYLDVATNVLSGPKVFAPVFFDLHRLPFTVLAIIGLPFVFWPRLDRQSPRTYLFVILFALLAPLVLLAGTTWQNARYLFMLLPILFIISGATLVDLVDRVPATQRVRSWQPILLALVVALFVGLTGSSKAYRQEWGYDQAFRFLREQREPGVGDRVLSMSPTACVLYLGQCDFFAIQHGYEEFLVSRASDGLPVDLWTATPVLTTTSGLIDLLETAPRVWLVSDGWRFQTRYDADFIQTVVDHMDLVYDERGVKVFRGERITPQNPAAIRQTRSADFDRALALVGFDLSTAEPQPGGELDVTLHWQALEQAGVGYTAFLHLVGADGIGVAGVDERVLKGLYQPALWPTGVTLADRHRLSLPSDLPPGRYRLDLGLYPSDQPDETLPVGGGDRLPLATLMVGTMAESPSPQTQAGVDFGQQIRLNGYDLDCAPQSLSCDLQLHWQGLAAMERDYTTFIHLVDEQNTILAQSDAKPGGAFFPTSTWLPGVLVLDQHHLEGPVDAQAGQYRILVGLYHQPTDERLESVESNGDSQGDAYLLATIPLGAESP